MLINGFGVGVKSRVVTLTDAQVKASPITPVTLVAAPGTGKMLIPLGFVLSLAWVADYTAINAAAGVQISYESGEAASAPLVNLEAASLTDASDFLAGGASRLAILPPLSQYGAGNPFILANTPKPKINLANQALVFSPTNGGVAFTGGDASNSITVTSIFIVIRV